MGKSAMIKVQVINKEGTIIAEAVGTKEADVRWRGTRRAMRT